MNWRLTVEFLDGKGYEAWTNADAIYDLICTRRNIATFKAINFSGKTERCGAFDVPNRHALEWDRKAMPGELAKMYGIDFIPDLPKKPEPDPVQDFISRRIAKRTDADRQAESVGIMTDAKADEMAEAQSKALGNSMSKLTHWEQTVHERIMPYRGVGL